MHWIIAALQKTVNLRGSIIRLTSKNRAPKVHICPIRNLRNLWEEKIFKPEENKNVELHSKRSPQVNCVVSETVCSSTLCNPCRSIMRSWCCKKLPYSEATPNAASEAGRCSIDARAEHRALYHPQGFHTSKLGREAPRPDAGAADQKRRVVPTESPLTTCGSSAVHNKWPTRKDGDTHLLSWQEKENQPETKDDTHYCPNGSRRWENALKFHWSVNWTEPLDAMWTQLPNKNSSSCPFFPETKAWSSFIRNAPIGLESSSFSPPFCPPVLPPSLPLSSPPPFFREADLISEQQYCNMGFSCEPLWRLVAANASHSPAYQWKINQRKVVQLRTHLKKRKRREETQKCKICLTGFKVVDCNGSSNEMRIISSIQDGWSDD